MRVCTRRWTAGTVPTLAVLTLLACTTISVSSTHYLGVPQFAPTDPNSVEIRRRVPERPHEKLGEVYLEPSGTPSIAELEQALRGEAARLGADGAVVVHDKYRRVGTVIQGPWWARSARPVYGHTFVAVAIRYTRR